MGIVREKSNVAIQYLKIDNLVIQQKFISHFECTNIIFADYTHKGEGTWMRKKYP